jgi:Protein of unknown function (DUF779)
MADVVASAAGRVSVPDAARQLIETLKKEYGALMFHQSGGCCDGSAPMCFQVLDGQRVASHWAIATGTSRCARALTYMPMCPRSNSRVV